MEQSFRELVRRSAADLDMQSQAVRRRRDFSLAEYVRSQAEVRPGFGPQEVRKIDSVYEISELCRQSSGQAPEGAWFPLAALTRDMTTTSDAGLASLTSTTGVRPGTELQAALLPHSAVLGFGQVLTGLTGADFDLLAIDADLDPSDQWNTEVGASASREPTMRPISMVAKTVRFSLNISRPVLMNRKLDVEGALRASILRRVLAEIDRAAFLGQGDAPAGLFHNSGVQVLAAGANGAAPSWDHVVELEYDASSRAGDMLAPHFITSPKLRKKLRKTPRGTGLDFILPGSSRELIGQPLRVSTRSPDNLSKGTSSGVCSALLFGDLAEMIIGFWGPAAVDISVDPVTRMDRGQVRLHVRSDVAVAVRNTGAFAVYKDLLAA